MKTRFSDEHIQAQLSRICSSGELKNKYRLKQLLDYIVKEHLAGRGKQIKNYSIGLNVFFRDKDFNPELDPIVRIEMGRLRRSLDNYYMKEGKADEIRFYIPKGSYLPEFISSNEIQFPLQNNNGSNNKPLKPTIVILPFTNITHLPDYEYFSQGFSEELTIELSHYDYYCVLGYSIKEDHHGNNNSHENLLPNLNPDYVLSGNVRRDDKQLKVTVKLNDFQSGEHLWGENYRKNLTPENIIFLQENIASEVASIIANEYGIIAQKIINKSRGKAPKDVSTYEAIFRYYYYQIHLTQETTVAAFNALEQVIVNEPECAVAIAMLATMYGTFYMLDLPGGDGALVKMIELINKAIVLEPDNQQVRLSYAWCYFVRNEKDLFLSEMKNVLASNPHTPFRIGNIGFYIALYGCWDEGKALLDKALKHNIGCPPWFHGVTCLYYYRLKNYEKAYEEAVKYNSVGIFWGPMLRIAVLGQMGDLSKTESNIRELFELKPDFETKAHFLIRRYVKEDELADHIIDGLNKAGLKISSNTIKEKII